MALPAHSRVVVRADVSVRSLGDGAVLVNMTTGTCFELNRVGFEIWELLAGGATPKSICDALSKRYGTPQETLAPDVQRLLEALRQHELVEWQEPGPRP
jgi:hypothetical protein